MLKPRLASSVTRLAIAGHFSSAGLSRGSRTEGSWTLSEKEDGGKCRECGAGLQRKYEQRLSRSPWQPTDCEERNDGHLRSHEQLKEMRSGPLIGLMDNAEHGGVAEHQGQGGEGH
jgi:hypothetical protein